MRKNTYSLFELFAFSWISVALFALFLAIVGLFYHWLLCLAIGIMMIAAIWLVKNQNIRWQLSQQNLVILGITLAMGLYLSFTTTPTLFGGRDEGSYTNAAILLVQDHSLNHPSPLAHQFFEIYGPGKALHFPGFYYDTSGALKSQFLPGYISWLAIWYDLFGVTGLKFSNLLPWLTFLFSFMLVIRETFQLVGEKAKKYDVLGLVLLSCSFPMILFAKFTLSEIFYAALAWTCLYWLLRYFQNKSLFNYVLIFIPIVIMLFTRIETPALAFMLFLILALKDYNHLKKPNYQFIFFMLGICLLIALMQNANFFVEQLKSLAQPFMPKSPSAGSNGNGFSDSFMDFYLIKIFYNYNLLPYFIMGTFALYSLIKSKLYRLLLPLLFFLPTLIFLIDANISLDHPWMLRRFLFSILPLFILYSCIFLKQLTIRQNWIFNGPLFTKLIVIFILAINLFLLMPDFNPKTSFLSFQQNRNLLHQTVQLAEKFSPTDLILISQKSSGNGWSLMAEPMRNFFGLNAVYFFNPNDLKKLDLKNYTNVYLITSENETSLYQNLAKETVSSYSIDNQLINPSKDPLAKAAILQNQTQGTIYKLSE